MPTPASSTRLRALHPLRILYADDFRELREFMRTILTKQGHLIEAVPDGRTALEWLQRAGGAVDLLITDHHMHAGMDGLELVRRVRAAAFPGKIVVFTSELSEAVLAEYRRLGVDLILPKAIFPVTLRRMLDELFTPDGNPARQRPPGDLVLA